MGLFAKNSRHGRTKSIPHHGRRLLALSFEGKPIFEPYPSHSLLLSSAGGGKTTCGALTWVLSMLADKARNIVAVDSKDGEMAAQLVPVLKKYHKECVVIDDFHVRSELAAYNSSPNPFGGVAASHVADNGELVFTSDSTAHALIEEPANDARNQYWRDEPRTLIEYALNTLLYRKAELATPGSVWSLISDPHLLNAAVSIDLEEAPDELASLARDVRGMQANQEHFPQHRSAALKALRIFSSGSKLHRCGSDNNLNHQNLISGGKVIFIIGPQRHMERLGAYYALHLQPILDAILRVGSETENTQGVDLILDEFTNAPLKELVSRLTTMRGFGGRAHMIAQSRSEIQRRYGEKETLTIEENAVVKQWFGFSSFDEAERVSKAMGDGVSISQSLSVSSNRPEIQGSFQTGKERLFNADELMRLPPDEQILHIKNVGFIHCKKLQQNQIAPYCFDLGDNPLEGRAFEPDPIIELVHQDERSGSDD